MQQHITMVGKGCLWASFSDPHQLSKEAGGNPDVEVQNQYFSPQSKNEQ